MKLLIIKVIVLFIILTQSSCLTSLQPIVNYENIVKEDRIVGSWQYNNQTFHVEEMMKSSLFDDVKNSVKYKNDMNLDLNLTRKDKRDSIFYSKAYFVAFSTDKTAYYYFAAMTHIGNNLFMQLYPIALLDSANENTSFAKFSTNYFPTFSYAKVETGNNKITLKFLNGDYIKEQIESGNMRIKHEKDQLFASYLVTASTFDVRQFLQKYGNDDRLYSPENSITLIKKY